MRVRRPALALLSAVIAGAGALSALVPADAAGTEPPAVKGSLTAAYKATRWAPPKGAATPQGSVHYFTGSQTDQVTKAGGTAPGFGRDVPSGSADAVQATDVAGGASGRYDDPLSAYWVGAFSGTIDGAVAFSWWWSSANPTSSLIGGNMTVRLVADPGTAQQKVIASEFVTVVGGAAEPTLERAEVKVKQAKVAKALAVQVYPRYADAGHEFRVHYGSAARPSAFVIPKGGQKPAPLPSTTRVKDTNPLRLAATDIGRNGAEPTMGVTKEGNAFIVAADFDGISPANPQTLIYASYDGNRTWKDVTRKVGDYAMPPVNADPYMYVDRETSRVFSDDLLVGCSYLQWSDDQGKTWSAGNPLACEAPVDDHQTIVTGNPPAGVTTRGYPNVLYYCVNKVADAQCARSLDGGQTLLPTGEPAFAGVRTGAGEEGGGSPGVCGGLHGHIVTDPEGRLYLPKGHCGNPWLAVSEDGGQTWRQSKVSDMRVAGTQTAVASDDEGNIFYVWWDEQHKLPYMAVSRDSGVTFGPAMLVAPPGVASVNFPSIDASGKGKVALSFPGTRNATTSDANRTWDYYVAVSTDALAAQPVFRSATANPPKDAVHVGACLGRCGGLYDFLDVVIAPTGTVWATLSDDCTRACAAEPAASRISDVGRAVVVKQVGGPRLGRRSPGSA